jgi:hypothetical protein
MNIAIKNTPFFISILEKIHTIKDHKYLYFIPESIEETQNGDIIVLNYDKRLKNFTMDSDYRYIFFTKNRLRLAITRLQEQSLFLNLDLQMIKKDETTEMPLLTHFQHCIFINGNIDQIIFLFATLLKPNKNISFSHFFFFFICHSLYVEKIERFKESFLIRELFESYKHGFSFWNKDEIREVERLIEKERKIKTIIVSFIEQEIWKNWCFYIIDHAFN